MKQILTAMIITGLAACAARAGGLLEQLAADGTWVRFDTITSSTPAGPESALTGSLAMSLVGTVTVDGAKCRWIEFKQIDKPDSIRTADDADASRTYVVKFLVPEQFLTATEKPLEHVLKMAEKHWIGRNSSDAKVVWTDKPNPVMGMWHLFLPGPLTGVRKLPQTTVDNKLGKLDCEVATGRSEVRFERMSATVHNVFERQLHKQAPFGVAGMRVTAEAKLDQGNDVEQKIIYTLKLVDAGTNAKSELPEEPQPSK